MSISLSLSIYIYIYMYIEIERERERERDIDRTGPPQGGAGIATLKLGILSGRNKKPNRTGRTEPNRTERRRVREAQAEPHRTVIIYFPNRTEPMNFRKSGTKTNRTEPIPSCFMCFVYALGMGPLKLVPTPDFRISPRHKKTRKKTRGNEE